ncbi:16S rRNA (uracil(1498)-N(3))-methyltransferase [Tepidicella baoligensis]|uniref:16S rRNA (uracil(1498)-N(3))-methyltransferase n=1 Tax=Tepidicella baoligensis TaxID=2707016 RepID=UPI0015D9DDAA|nr:16S rRNA (uracil(1498)-N(3))-methyltransferase [Tepidicella baoligensis]
MPRIHHPEALHPGQVLTLTPEGARHVQVLRLQPGDALTLFGDPVAGGEWTAIVLRMGRSRVEVQVQAHQAVEREPLRTVQLAVGMPANERMDWLVEKATELGVAGIQPLMTERTVLRLKGERADKKQAHWQAVAVSACEQCGGNRVPTIHPVRTLDDWLRQAPPAPGVWRGVLSLAADSRPLSQAIPRDPAVALCLVHGPEGGLGPAEEQTLRATGFVPVSLGPRVLRAETAALAALVRALS